MKQLSLFLFLLIISINSFSQWVEVGFPINGISTEEQTGQSVTISEDGSIVAVGAPHSDAGGDFSGQVRIYKNQSNNWIQIDESITGNQYEGIGYSIDLNSDGSVIVIGSRLGNISKVYRNNGISWEQIGSDLFSTIPNTSFGFSVSINSEGNIIAISNRYENGLTDGYAYVNIYQNIDESWVQIGNTIYSETIGDLFGTSISLNANGDILLIGSIGVSNTLAGYAKIFKLESDTWLQLGNSIQSTSMSDYFGSSVSINSEGNRIAIGAPENSEIGLYAGKVSLYEYSSTDWIQIGQMITGENTGDRCGIVHLSGNGQMLAIGETGNNQNGLHSGKCRVFSFFDNQWNQVEQSIYGSTQGDWFGSSIGLNGDGSVLIIGAPCNDINGIESGQAKVFQLNTNSDVVTLKSETIKVLPNPSKAIFNVSTIEDVQVNVFSSNGDLLFSTNKKEVDLQNYSKGIYYLRVLEKSIVKTFRVILE